MKKNQCVGIKHSVLASTSPAIPVPVLVLLGVVGADAGDFLRMGRAIVEDL